MSNSELPLSERHIAVPESRELDLFASMLTQRGARVLRCPLVSIHDSPDREIIENWITRFLEEDFDDLVLLTGEGLRRLRGFAERSGTLEAFTAKLARVRKITRGPKPARALREMGLKSDVSAATPTTEGIIETLSAENLSGRRIAVQLYGQEPNLKLVGFLEQQGATVSCVAPYIYATDAEEAKVRQLIDAVIAGELDAMAFTSRPQVERLLKVARATDQENALLTGLNNCNVAAVGPVVAESLRQAGIQVSLMPETQYFMKPLVRQLVLAFSQ